MSEFRRRLWMLLRRGRFDADLDEEMRLHRELRERDAIERGTSREEARYAARRRFGNDLALREESREVWGWTWLENFRQDARYGARTLAKNPAFAAVAALTLALGIGANTAIFSVMNAVTLRFLPVPDPQQLVYLRCANRPGDTSQSGEDEFSFTEHTFEQLRREPGALSALVAFVPAGLPKVEVRYGDAPEETSADMVSGNFFSGLRVKLERGRGFTLEDESQHAQVAVLSDDYWSRRFARDSSVVGRTLFVKGVPFAIIGVAGRGFFGVEPVNKTDLWIPLQDRHDLTAWGQSDADGQALYGSKPWWCLMMIGRMAHGVSQEQALAELNPIFEQSAYWGGGKERDNGRRPRLYFTPARGIESLRETYGEPLRFLMAMVALVLVIACANVAMLLVARNAARQREFSLRVALGASRARLFRQLLTESVMLVGAGAALGWLFAGQATGALAAWSDFDVDLAPDHRVLAFTVLVSVVAALVFGLAPLRHASLVPPGLALKTSAAASSQDRGRNRSGRTILTLQMSLCLVLLVSAGSLERTLRNLAGANLGLRASGLLVFGISPPPAVHNDAEARRFFQTLTLRVRALPGVESLTLMENRIGSGWSSHELFSVDGVLPLGDTDEGIVRWNAVGPDYFHTLGIPLLLGRDLTGRDDAGAPQVVVINQTFAERLVAGRNPIGRRLEFHWSSDNRGPYTIVGVAANSKYRSVDEAPRPMAYFPYTQIPGVATMHFELRTEGNPAAMIPDVERAVRGFGPDLALLEPMTQQEQFSRSYSEQRVVSRLAGFFGLMAALLVATGLYGTLAYKVSRRTPEIGVRMALGAERRTVLWMILRESLTLALAGVLIGLIPALGAARLLRSMLYGLGPADPLTFIAAPVGIALVALGASYIPARRATKIDPIVALRCE